MKFRVRPSALNFLLVALLSASLLALAVLQYRWIGQTSDDERERLRRAAERAAENLGGEFNRELTRAFLLLQINRHGFDRENSDEYAARYDRWLASSPYPKMVGKVFVAERGGASGVRLSVYDEAARRFDESADWAPELARLRGEIERDLGDENPNGAAGGAAGKGGFDFVAADVPALVIPISAVNLPELVKSPGTAARGGAAALAVSVRRIGYTIVLLDADYIKRELLPALVTRHFNFADERDGGFEVVVASRDTPPKIFYQSASPPDPAPPAGAPPEGDVERDLFALRLEEIKNIMPESASRPQPQPQHQQRLPRQAGDDKQKRRVSVSVVTTIRAPGSAPADQTAGAFFTYRQGGWRLIARHGNGSLAAAVESARRRNLLVSFAVLVLLAASGILLIVLLNRERLLARRQNAFVASVSHELRTPLAAIRATSENIADGIVTDPARIREYGLLINEEERRLSAMVEQMLEFAGARKAKNQADARRRVSVAETVAAALADHRAELERWNFEVEVEIDPGLPEIFADPEALRRAVGNLLGNAVKYRKAPESRRGSPRVEITARRAESGASGQIEIAVRDNGAGIEKKDLAHIFKLFYRGRAAEEAQIKGSGIGLSLVRQIVEAHGGEVGVQSTPGEGSTFTLRLPVDPAAAAAVGDRPA